MYKFAVVAILVVAAAASGPCDEAWCIKNCQQFTPCGEPDPPASAGCGSPAAQNCFNKCSGCPRNDATAIHREVDGVCTQYDTAQFVKPPVWYTKPADRENGCDIWKITGCGAAAAAAAAACGALGPGDVACILAALSGISGCGPCLCASIGCPSWCPCDSAAQPAPSAASFQLGTCAAAGFPRASGSETVRNFVDASRNATALLFRTGGDDTADFREAKKAALAAGHKALRSAPRVPSFIKDPSNDCSDKGTCGNAYQACCIAFQIKGYPCGCHLQDGTGKVGANCGDCGTAFGACCIAETCKCDIS